MNCYNLCRILGSLIFTEFESKLELSFGEKHYTNYNREHTMQAKVPITIHLDGAGVKDGSILIEDLVPALQGFSSAYGKIASNYSQNLNHKIRVESFKPGSFIVSLSTTILEHRDALDVAANAATVVGSIGNVGTVVYKVIDYVIKTLSAKKHIKNKPFTQQVNYNSGSVVIINADNVELTVPLEVYQIVKAKTIDTDLNKIASLIDEENIKELSITYEKNGEVVSEKIDADSKKYFNIDDTAVSETKDSWITCKINSLTKTTNRGQAYLPDGTRVGFKLAGETPDNLYKHFAHKGWVKMYCKVKLDESLKPIELDVYDIQQIEYELPFETPKDK